MLNDFDQGSARRTITPANAQCSPSTLSPAKGRQARRNHSPTVSYNYQKKMINRLEFSIDIKAEKTTIWNALWNQSSYREWASVFFEGSYAVTDNWKEGSKVHFLAPHQSGIYSIIEKHIPNNIIQFKHIGNVVGGKEQPIDDETKNWSGTTEIYKLTEEKDHNTLVVEIDVLNEHLEFMTKTFPKALEKLKNNCR